MCRTVNEGQGAFSFLAAILSANEAVEAAPVLAAAIRPQFAHFRLLQ